MPSFPSLDDLKKINDEFQRKNSTIEETAADILGRKNYSSLLSGNKTEEVKSGKFSIRDLDALKTICKTIIYACVIQAIVVIIGYNLYNNEKFREFQIYNNETLVAIRAGLQQCYVVNENEVIAVKNHYADIIQHPPIVIWKKDCNEK